MNITNFHPAFIWVDNEDADGAAEVASAIQAIWGFAPRAKAIRPASNGVWMIPVPTEHVNSNAYVWAEGKYRIQISA
jgi:hypothetical protein